MGAMQRQIEEFVARLNVEFSNQPFVPEPEKTNSLIPVARAMPIPAKKSR